MICMLGMKIMWEMCPLYLASLLYYGYVWQGTVMEPCKPVVLRVCGTRNYCITGLRDKKLLETFCKPVVLRVCETRNLQTYCISGLRDKELLRTLLYCGSVRQETARALQTYHIEGWNCFIVFAGLWDKKLLGTLQACCIEGDKELLGIFLIAVPWDREPWT